MVIIIMSSVCLSQSFSGVSSTASKSKAGKTSLQRNTDQFKINRIHSYLFFYNVHSNKALAEHIDPMLNELCKDRAIFSLENADKDFVFLQDVIRQYAVGHGDKLCLPSLYKHQFIDHLKQHDQPGLQAPPTDPDLIHVTRSYDDLEKAKRQIQKTSKRLSNLVASQKDMYCPNLIIGLGDTATTIWLEKYKERHNNVSKHHPSLMMIGKDMGSWGHDYTLAQRHSFLERSGVKTNPSDYMGKKYYKTNPYTNSRHVLQSNIANLASTGAPLLLGMDILRIEKQENHTKDWAQPRAKYRVIIKNPKNDSIYPIYTDTIDASTGLGPAKNVIGGVKNSRKEEILDLTTFERLNRYDPKKGFTPIVDGNLFVLTPTEQLKKRPRTIIIYGGGGTGAACYRIAFHDHDNRTEETGFNEKHQVNKGMWIAARGFESAGSGRLVKQVFERAKEYDELRIAELMKIVEGTDGKLYLLFHPEASSGVKQDAFVVECDQLVYSAGQETSQLMEMIREVSKDLELTFNKDKVPFAMRSRDKFLHFFGAGAMALKGKDYADVTWKWLDREHIGRDVGPGSMPPTRAQIKAYLTENGTPLENVNVNVDDHTIIEIFLTKAGLDSVDVQFVLEDILTARGETPWGMSQEKLQSILNYYELNDRVKIFGHGYLIRR